MYQYTLKGLGYCHILHSVCFYLPKIVHVYAFLNLVQFYMYVQDLGTLNFSVFQKRLVNTVTICMVRVHTSQINKMLPVSLNSVWSYPKYFILQYVVYFSTCRTHMQIKRNSKSLMFCDSFSRLSTELYNMF